MFVPVLANLMQDEWDDSIQTTSGFPDAVKLQMADAYGDILEGELYIKTTGGDWINTTAEQNDLVPFFGGETITAINPITRRREIASGTVQGGVWQVKVTNNNDWFSGYDIGGGWAAVYGAMNSGRAVLAQGKIIRVSNESDGTIMIEIHDSIMDVLNYELTRDMKFQLTGWVSEVKPEAVSSGSDGFDSAQIWVLDTYYLRDETFVIEFTTTTDYKIILESGDDTQSGDINNDFQFSSQTAPSILKLLAAGWGTTYSTGDRFVFYTSRYRTTSTLTPVIMIRHLLDDVMGATAYDVYNDSVIPTVAHDSAQWSAMQALYNDYSIYGLGGEFPRGTKIGDMINGILKFVNGSIYPAQDGTIALWLLDVAEGESLTLNGNIGAGDVDIISARSEDDYRALVNDVTFKYLGFDAGDDRVYHTTDADTSWPETRAVTIDIGGWWVKGPALESAANIYLARFKDSIKRHYLDTTLAGAAAEIGKQVLFSDDTIGASLVQTDVTEMSTDLMNNSAQLVAYIDPVAAQDYAKVGTATVDGPEVIL